MNFWPLVLDSSTDFQMYLSQDQFYLATALEQTNIWIFDVWCDDKNTFV